MPFNASPEPIKRQGATPMAQIIYPCQHSWLGPWLLDAQALEKLDTVLIEQWKVLEAHKKRLINNAVEREKYQMRKLDWYNKLPEADRIKEDEKIREKAQSNPEYADDGIKIVFTLPKGRKVLEDSFHKAIVDPALVEEVVTKAEFNSHFCGGVKATLVVPATATAKDKSLSIITLPEGSEPARELFVRLQLWADEHQPGWLRRLNGVEAPGIVILAGLFYRTARLHCSFAKKGYQFCPHGITMQRTS